MNTYEFFMEYFGRHLIDAQGLTAAQGAEKALSSNHKTIKGTLSRLSSGWAIVRPGDSSLQLKLAAKGLQYDNRTRLEAFVEELVAWDGKSPRIFLEFDKAPVSISNLFITVDRRLVRICSPKNVAAFDMSVAPTDASPIIQRAIWKRLPK
jgi:hypothetical protein